MKKIILLFLIPLFMGCASYYKQATIAANNAYIGMSISEFKEMTGKKAKLEALEPTYTVYRMNNYYSLMSNMTTDTKFFYFNSSGKLYKIDGGVPQQSRSQIEIINK